MDKIPLTWWDFNRIIVIGMALYVLIGATWIFLLMNVIGPAIEKLAERIGKHGI